MAFKIAEAFVEIQGDKGKFSATIRGAKRETSGFSRSATKDINQVTTALKRLAVAAAAAAVIAIGVKLTKATVRAGASAIQTAVKYDRLRIGLIAVTGSAAKTAEQLISLRKIALAPGLSFEQAIRGSIALQAAGVEAALAERSLSAFGNALAAAGREPEVLSRVNLQLSQIAAKTSGFGRDLLVIREAVPAIGPILAKAFADKPLEDLSISGKELIKTLVEGLEGLGQVGESVGNNLVNLGVSFDLLKKTIGDTMLDITSDTAKSLAEIINKISMIIPVWKQNQDAVATVFKNIGVIAIRTTGAMLVTLAGMIKDVAVIMWEPLADGLKLVFAKLATETHIPITFASDIPAINRAVAKLNGPINDAFKKLGDAIAGGEGVKGLEEKLGKSTEKALSALAGVGLERFDKLTTDLTAGLKDINIELDGFVDTLPKAEATTAASAKSVFDLAAAFRTLGGVIDFNKKGFAEFGRVAGIHLGNIGVSIGDARDLAHEFGEAARENLERIAEQTQRVVDTIAPAFENMFTAFFSGNTKSLWENFWNDLKRIAIRQMATIFATQLLTGLLTGGTSFAATGAGALLGGLAPRSVDPTTRAIAGGVSGAARAVGGFLEGGTVIINDQDLTNFDTQRLTKQVEQGIAPALAEAAADGIQ